MSRAILYIRVSTDEQADKGYSQRNQDEVLHRYCALKSVAVHEVIYEDHSAKTFKRPEWSKMLINLKKLKNRPGVSLILFTKWDRFSRNTADAYQMIAILRNLGIEPQAIEQPLDLSVPENKMMLAFYLAVPEVENDRRALNIFYGMRRAKKEGRWISSAPTGYVNRSTEDGRKYIRPNEPLAGIMKNAFTRLATGRQPVDQVWQQARREGLTCNRQNFHNLIRNPVYCGQIFVPPHQNEDAYLAEGQHEPIISTELFEQVQRVLNGRRRQVAVKKDTLKQLPLRGFLLCSHCGRLLTGSASKGRNSYYAYYHCSRTCGVRFKAEQVNADFEQLLKDLKPKRAYQDLFKAIARDVFKQQTATAQDKRLQTLAQLETLQTRLKKARELLLAEAVTIADYQLIKTENEEKATALQAALDQLPDTEPTITQLLNRKAKRFLDLHDLYTNASLENKRKLACGLLASKLIYTGQAFETLPLTTAGQLVYTMLNN